jgi:AcrR family transcriptional regulator
LPAPARSVKVRRVKSGAYHHGDLAAALLGAADELLVAGGAAKLSLRQIAAHVGVAPSAAYHHFADRDALVDRLGVRYLDELAGVVRRRLRRVADDDTEAQLVALGRAYVQWARARPARFAIAFGPGRARPDVTHNRRPYEILEAIFAAAVARGELSPGAGVDGGVILWPALHGFAVLAVSGPYLRRPSREILQQTELLVRTILAGLRARA